MHLYILAAFLFGLALGDSFLGRIIRWIACLPWQMLNLITMQGKPRTGSLNDAQLSYMYDIQVSNRLLLNLEHSKSHWMNFGYWEKAVTYQDACEALTNLVASSVHINEFDTVLDSGCGCADQDIYISNTFHPKYIHGIELAETQVSLANAMLIESKSQHKIGVSQHSATDILNFYDARKDRQDFNVVISIDSAYHYDSRLSFLKQSFEILKKHSNGRIGLSDAVLTSKWHDYWKLNESGALAISFRELLQPLHFLKKLLTFSVFRIVCRVFAVPPCNLCTLQIYKSQLDSIGFKNIVAEKITTNVFEGFPRFIETHRQQLSAITIASKWMQFSLAGKLLQFLSKHQIIDYVIISAVVDKSK